MKQGDVFVVEGKEPLYIADRVTPSGAIYARKFDVYKGAYGGLEAFQASSEYPNSASFLILWVCQETMKK